MYLEIEEGSGQRRWTVLAIGVVAAVHLLAIALLMDVEPRGRESVQLLRMTVRTVELAPPAPEKPMEPPREKPQRPAARPVKPAESPPVMAAAPDPEPVSRAFAVPPQPPAEKPAPPPAPAPITAARFDADYLRNPAPAYPLMSRRLGEQGSVLLLVRVGADGSAERVQVRQTSGFPRLDEAALAAVRNWRFVPARRGDEAVAADVLVPVAFRLDR